MSSGRTASSRFPVGRLPWVAAACFMLLIAATRAQAVPTCLSILRTSSSPTKATSVAFTVLFSENVTGVDTGDFSVDSSGITGPLITAVTAIDQATYVVSVGTGTGNGTVSIDLIDNDSIHATAGAVPLGGAGAGNGSFTGGQSYTVDKTAPTVTLTKLTTSPSKGASVQFDVTFSEAVDPLPASEVVVNQTGSISHTTPTVSQTTTSKYRVTVGGLSGAGTVSISLAAGATTDLADNETPAVGPGSSVTVDRVAPTVTIATSTDDIGEATSATFTVTFSESVTGFDVGDVVVAHDGTSHSAVAVQETTARKYVVTISGLSGDGSFAVGVKSGAAADAAGNASGATAASATVRRGADGGSSNLNSNSNSNENNNGDSSGGPGAAMCGAGGFGVAMLFAPIMTAMVVIGHRRRRS